MTQSLKFFAVSLLPVVTLGVTIATIAITLTPTCAHAGQCGGCYISGKSGFVAWKGLVQYCLPCHSVKPESLLADHDGLPEPRRGTHRLVAWKPPVNDGPGKTGGSGTRNS